MVKLRTLLQLCSGIQINFLRRTSQESWCHMKVWRRFSSSKISNNHQLVHYQTLNMLDSPRLYKWQWLKTIFLSPHYPNSNDETFEFDAKCPGFISLESAHTITILCKNPNSTWTLHRVWRCHEHMFNFLNLLEKFQVEQNLERTRDLCDLHNPFVSCQKVRFERFQ